MKKLITVLCVSLMWVGNYYSKLYAYDMASKARVPAKDFTLTSDNDYSFWHLVRRHHHVGLIMFLTGNSTLTRCRPRPAFPLKTSTTS